MRALRLGDAGVGRGQRDLRHPAGEMILFLGDQFGEAVIDDLAELVDILRRLGETLDRRLRIGQDLLIVLVAVDDLLAHVEIEQSRQRADALAHVLVVAGDFVELVEEFFRKKVGVRVDRAWAFLSLLVARLLAPVLCVPSSRHGAGRQLCVSRATSSAGIGCD